MIKKDRYNDEILRELVKDGRISNTVLAEKVGLSPSACLRRVQELENSGLITGYRAVLNSEKLGIKFIAYVNIGLVDHSMKSQFAFEQAIAEAPEVKECHNVTGEFEYLLRVETTDIKAYKAFHVDTLGEIPQVNMIRSNVVMESPKDERA